MEKHHQTSHQGHTSHMPLVLEVVVVAWLVLDKQCAREEVQLLAAVPVAGPRQGTVEWLPAVGVPLRRRQTGQTARQLACVQGMTNWGAAALLLLAPRWSVGLALFASHWKSHLRSKAPGLHSLSSRSDMQPGRPRANGLNVLELDLGVSLGLTSSVLSACRPAMEEQRPKRTMRGWHPGTVQHQPTDHSRIEGLPDTLEGPQGAVRPK